MGLSGFGSILLAALTPTLAPDKPGDTPGWTVSGPTATAKKADIEVPLSAGTMSRLELRDLGQDEIDLVAQYGPPDRLIYGTIFLYRPTLPDSGLTFLATDEAIRRRFGENVQVVDDKLIAIGGVMNAGRRIFYSSSDARLSSSGLVIIQAGKWMLKLRVSGPASRTSEIADNLDALVDGLKFGKGSEPLPIHVIRTEPCQNAKSHVDAELKKPQGPDAIALALVAAPGHIDPDGRAVADPLRRVPDRLCLYRSDWDDKIPLLTFRTISPASPGIFEPKLFQLYGDAGIIVEVTRLSKGPAGYFALRHAIGEAVLYGAFSSEPSDAQLAGMRKGSSDLPVIAIIRAKDSGTDIQAYCNRVAEGCEKAEEPSK